MKKIISATLCVFMALTLSAKVYMLESPDSKLDVQVTVENGVSYSVSYDGCPVIDDAFLAMTLSDRTWGGQDSKVMKVRSSFVDADVPSPFYRADKVRDCHNSMILDFKGGWAVEFRAYNDGYAYRFISRQKSDMVIVDETVELSLAEDAMMTVPYVLVEGTIEEQLFNSFENVYAESKTSGLKEDQLMMLPLSARLSSGLNVCFLESDLESYPGLYLLKSDKKNTLEGYLPKYPKSAYQGGHNMLEMIVTEREDYIAKVKGTRSFPWRGAVIGTDVDLANSNLSYLLASPSKIADISWIRSGKVAWEWWNDLNLEGVDFVTGVNNETYRYYIDFAAANGVEYVILDEGWAVNLAADLMQIVPEIDLKGLVDYATSKNVGIILWAGYHAFDRDMENVCRHYSEMGVKGFKVDFMDRDDQIIVDFIHRAAETASRYGLLLDFHGMYKPAGLNRTWPNIINVEGVFGLEQMKFREPLPDMITYDAQLPFIRQVSGPMDYTQGAMRNCTKESAYMSFTEPVSLGTRAHQLALYVIFESPLNMLCDSPTNYEKESECLEVIAEIPTIWNESKVLEGMIGDYVVTARRNGDTWYVGGITDWDARDVKVDLSFLPEGKYEAVLYKDGVNAHRKATDYRKVAFELCNDTDFNIHMAPGGGFLMKIKPL